MREFVLSTHRKAPHAHGLTGMTRNPDAPFGSRAGAARVHEPDGAGDGEAGRR
jgi:hypothetical protein